MSERFPCIAVYIMASRPFGVLYVGVTGDLPRRAFEHREGLVPGFTLAHGCKMLVWYEVHNLITEAVAREKRVKKWRRMWKYQLIEQMNEAWADLYPTLHT
ncbi:MAG TPA: GIY-YIG nuclease family protein [Caulobacteraceae bacterium]|nr:GIY-YIG nuclease family protein [Caulobacteraceae bacterium]